MRVFPRKPVKINVCDKAEALFGLSLRETTKVVRLTARKEGSDKFLFKPRNVNMADEAD